MNEQDIQKLIDTVDEKTNEKTNWNKVWAKKYPILETYQSFEGLNKYQENLEALVVLFQKEYGLSKTDAFLAIKDILARIYKEKH